MPWRRRCRPALPPGAVPVRILHSCWWCGLFNRGEWKERKITPDEWSIYYETRKRRAGKAPERSGTPVGTRYNWLIVSHRMVLDARL